jgi:hypothetical protein
MPAIFVLDVPEFLPLVEKARGTAGFQVSGPARGYFRLEAHPTITFRRKELGFKPAVWHGALTGGLIGRITHYDNDLLEIAEEAQS